MNNLRTTWLLALLAICTSIQFQNHAKATDTSTRLQMTTRRMQEWLGTGEKAIGWRRYLKLNVLDTQAAKGPYADPNALLTVLRQFQSGANGLDHPNFVACRQAIIDQLDHLQRVNFKNIAQQLENAKSQFVPIADVVVVAAQQQASNDTRLMLDYYKRNLVGLEYQDIDEILVLSEIEDLVQRIDSDQPLQDSELISDFRNIVLRMNRVAMRLHDPYFPVARESLAQLFYIYFYRANVPNLEQIYLARLNRIQQSLETLQQGYDRQAANMLGLDLGFLTHTQQVPELVTALKAEYSMPNFMLSVSETALTRIASRPVNQTQPVNEQILDQHIFGTAHTNGQINIDAVNDPNQAHFSIQLLGNVHADNYSQTGPITIYSGSDAAVEARRSVLLNVHGLLEYGPYAAANLGSYFQGASTGPFLQGIVGRIFDNQKGKYQPIAARRAEMRLLNEFRQETDQAFRDGRQRLAEAREENARLLAMRPNAYMTTSDTHFWMVGQRQGIDQIASPMKAIQSRVKTDVQVHMHESIVNNYFESALAGRAIDSKNYPQQLSEIFGPMSIDLQDDPNEEKFTIVFSTRRPVEVQFDDNRIVIRVRGQTFTRGERPINHALDIFVRFKFVKTAEGVQLVRDGDVDVEFVTPEVNAEKSAFRSFLRDRLNEIANEPANNKPLNLSNNLMPVDQVPELQKAENLRYFKLANLNINDGWFNVGWNFRPGTVVSDQAQADLPSLFEN